jgi:hypothetical protein
MAQDSGLTIEIPLVFPSLEAYPRRFKVNDVNHTIREYRSAVASPVKSQRNAGGYDQDDSLSRGAASISSLRGGGGTRDAVLTTSFLPDQPGLLAVALLPACDKEDADPVLIQLDLGSETARLGPLIKVKAFYWTQLDQPISIALVLVDTTAIVIRIQLDPITLSPIRPKIDLWSVGDMISTKVGFNLESARLHSAMVVPLSPTTLLMAVNPFLFAVDLNQSKTVIWSKFKCLEDMQTRSSSIGTLLAKGVDLLIGKRDHSQVVDLLPVAALCTADNDPRQVFSLHSDGILRHWTLQNMQDLEPWQVCEPPAVQNIPPYQTWCGSDFFAVAMTARMYDATFALAIHIRTYTSTKDESSMEDNEDDDYENTEDFGSASCSHLVVIDVPPVELAGDMPSHSIRLQVPASAQSLVGMTFDPCNASCSLLALFQSTGSSAIYVTYPPSLYAMVSREGVTTTASDCMLDGLAQRERQRIINLSFADSASGATLEDQLTALDRRFLQYLFRPAFPRGTGRMLPPLNFFIKRALEQLVVERPERGSSATTTKASIELETVRAVHAMRRKPHMAMVYGSPLKRMTSRTMKTPGTDMAQAGDTMTVYETIIETPGGNIMQIDEENDNYAELNKDTRLELQAHEARWKSLMLEIWNQEQSERSQLCMTIPDIAFAGDFVGGALIVRAGSVAVLRRGGISSQPATLCLLDEMASKVKGSCGEGPAGELDSLLALESKIWDIVCRGAVGVEDDILTKILLSLESFALKRLLGALTTGEMERLVAALAVSDSELISMIRDDLLAPFLQGSRFCNSIVSVEPAPTCKRGHTSHQRAAAAALAIRSVESSCQVLLGRLVVSLGLSVSVKATTSIFRMYIHCMTVLWTSAQRVNMRFLSTSSQYLKPLRLELSLTSSTKGTSETSFSSILAAYGERDKTTVVDSLLIYLSDNLPNLVGNVMTSTSRLASHAAAALLSAGGTHHGDTSSAPLLAELAVIPSSTGALTDEPKLALRLLGVSIAIPDDYRASVCSAREKLFAECLLVASSSERLERADAMVAAAIDMLCFIPDDLTTSMKRVTTVCFHLRGKSSFEQRVTKFILGAIDQTPPSATDDLTQLWSLLFETSTALGKWENAFNASISSPDMGKRINCLKRLVRSMVDAGALLELLEICSRTKNAVSRDDRFVSPKDNADLYAIAVETLSATTGLDLFSYLAADPAEPLSDCSGALYALHASQGQWKMAADTLDARYENSRKALVNGSPSAELGIETLARREAIIVEDLVLSSLGCVLTIKQVHGASSKFLALGDCRAILPDTPRFQTLEELSTRAAISVALKKLFLDILSVGKPFALSALCNRATLSENFTEFLDLLFANGYYHDGLMAARACSKLTAGKPNGRGLFAEALGHLLCNYLVPLASGQRLPQDGRPTLSQLQGAYETTVSPPELPSVLGFGWGNKKVSALYSAAVRVGALGLIHRLTLEYSTAETPVAVEVAACMLEAGPLPSWLEQILLQGCGDGGEIGLFAKRPKRDSNIYLGDPSALLSLYSNRGMYVDACRVAHLVLSLSSSAEGQKQTPCRLPEKGNMDFVPYNKIDILWNLIELVLEEGTMNEEHVDEVVAARRQMEAALERHFELLQISESGLQSARMLY